MRSFLGLACLLLLSVYGKAQTPGDSVRNIYIKSYGDKFFMWPVLKQRSLSFELQNPKQIGNTVQFKPNNAYGVGLGVYLFDLGLEFVFAVPLQSEKEENYGKTSATDLQLNILSRRWGADIFYQKYNGFYLANPDTPVPPGEPYPIRPDITTENFGLSGIYIFNHKKFSLRSAFTFADRQLKSRGSFIVSGTFNTFRASADSAILNNHYRTRIGLITSISSAKYQTLSLAPGYGYNLVLGKFFLSGLLAIGPAVQWLNYHDPGGTNQSVNTVNTYVDFRFAIGYSNDRFFTGITYAAQGRNVQFENIQLSNTSSTGRILFGWRFTETGFLKASVWDLLPKWARM